MRTPGDRVILLSDCGFSFKKGTGVLIDSFRCLLAEQLPVRLVLYGGIAKDQLDYWTRRLDDLKRTSSPHVECPGNVGREVIYAAFQSADVFCSATLGEGSSSGRIAAVCAGLPVVTTRCGEMDSDIDGVSHVRLADVADADDFLFHLRMMVRDIMDGTVRIDSAAVERWTSIYAEEREAAAWNALIRRTASGP
jgi:glycosyltransferase involved in cell wall biosynthesis